MFRNHFNLYIGWGLKYDELNPSQPSRIESECAQEFRETADPTVEAEHAFEEAQRMMSPESMSEEYMSTYEDYDEGEDED